jgi:MFS family permease
VSHESPKNVLVTEHYSRKDWERSWGFYEGLTEIGFIIGLIIGLFMFASTTVLVTESMLVIYTFYLCSALSVVAFILAWALIADPLIIFERRLVGIERKLDKASRGFEGLSKLMDGLHWNGSLKEDSFLKFAFAIVLFALATSLFFTPLPIILNQRLNLPTSMVYVAYILNSLGATVGYFLIRARAQLINIKKQMPLFVLLRSVLIFALVGVIWFAFSPTITTAIVLVMLIFIGFAYAMYYIMMLSQSMEIIPQGKAGFFDGMVGLGAAIGAFLGPFLTYELNYLPVFVITAVIFLVAFIILKISR